MPAKHQFLYIIFGYTLLSFGCATATEITDKNPPIENAEITQYSSLREGSFTVEKQHISITHPSHKSELQPTMENDNRSIVSVMSKNNIDITNCNYEVDVEQHQFEIKTQSRKESLKAYQYHLDFFDCPKAKEHFQKLEKTARYPSTISVVNKNPTTFYFLNNKKEASLVSLYGLPTYYGADVVEVVLKKIKEKK